MDRRSRSTINGELEELEKRIQTLRLREDEIQAVIESMHRLKDTVTTERLVLRSKGFELHAEREPINWLPPELLIQIFIAFCASDSIEHPQRAPVILSHVCRRWRNIATHTPHVWTRLLLRTFSEHEYVETHLTRSGAVPFEMSYISSRKNTPNSESIQVANLLITTRDHFHRIEKLTLQCNAVMPFVYFMPSINHHVDRFPLLSDLTLSISQPNPSFYDALHLRSARWPQENNENKRADKPYSSPLRRLKLEQIPLLAIPRLFVANLVSLELSFPPKKSSHESDYQYRFKMSTLGRFLSATPLLEELVLNNTIPVFDTILPSKDTTAPAAESPWVEMSPVQLTRLKTIDWTFACVNAVHELFTWIIAPNLERLDIWVERNAPSGSRDITYARGGHQQPFVPVSESRPLPRGVVHFSNLRDLSLQYSGEDTIASVLRRFRLPILERAAFTEVESHPAVVSPVVHQSTSLTPLPSSSSAPYILPPLRRPQRWASGSDATMQHTFPRLESILFDPRMTHLTHLTLSHQKIARDAQRSEAMLGYMPVLTYLSLDSCTGVRWLLHGLQEIILENGAGKGGSRRGVKVCPRLEALSFWSCPDVDFESVRAVVIARNPRAAAQAHLAQGYPARGNQATSSGKPIKEGNKHAKGLGQEVSPPEAHTGRKIKPLRRPRSEMASGTCQGASSGTIPSTNIVSKIIAIEESFQPANIIYLRVANCILIDEDELLSLRDFDVVDILWSG